MPSPLTLIILFGSHAKGRARATSDVDVAVLADQPLTLRDKIALMHELEQRPDLPRGMINLVDLQTAPPLLEHEVATTGKLLEGTEHDFIRFKVRAWKRYQDSAKFRRIRRERLLTSLAA